MTDGVTPKQAADILGPPITAGDIYIHLRRKDIPTANEKPLLVRVEDAKKYFDRHPKRERGRGRPKGSRNGGVSSGVGVVKKGDILSWDKQSSRNGGTSRRTVAQVFDTEEDALAWLTTDQNNGVWAFRTDKLSDRIDKGEIQIEHPIEVLRMIARQFNIQGQPELENAVRECSVFCEKLCTTTTTASVATS